MPRRNLLDPFFYCGGNVNVTNPYIVHYKAVKVTADFFVFCYEVYVALYLKCFLRDDCEFQHTLEKLFVIASCLLNWL